MAESALLNHPRLQRRGRIEACRALPAERRDGDVIHGFNAVAELKQLNFS